MPMNAEAFHPATEDPVSNVLKWILLTGSSGGKHEPTIDREG